MVFACSWQTVVKLRSTSKACANSNLRNVLVCSDGTSRGLRRNSGLAAKLFSSFRRPSGCGGIGGFWKKARV